jgi:lipoprotein Spr
MQKIFYLNILCIIVLLGSCKSMKNISAKNTSSVQRTKQTSNNSFFLDNISITPGNERTSVLNTSTTLPSYTARNAAKNFDIESAQAVQIKYATMLDVPVEDLTNIALLQDLDYWWGTKYCMGGSTQNCIDCSSFTQTIIRDIYSIQLPRTAEEQFNTATPINASDLQEGDLVFFQTTGRTISHVGVYLANNKFAHASTSGGVMISDLNEEYWKKRFRAAGRVKK